MRKIFDCIVIGGGVVGCSIFNKLVRIGKKTALLDSASDVATGATKANSGLIHAGYDPEPNTLKAKLNVRGNHLFPSICARLGVDIKKTGALVVGDDQEKINNLYSRGITNGVEHMHILSRKELIKKVPHLQQDITIGLFAEDAYVVSPYLYTIALAEEGIINGGEIYLEQDIVKCEKVNNIFIITTKNETFKAKNIINSAGAGYNEISKILGSEKKKIEFRRGEYFVFEKDYNLNVPCTVFPLPTKKGKGVLVTPTIDGDYLVGPTSEESNTSTVVTKSGLDSIREKSSLILDNINFKKAIREFSGIRTICGNDFVIENSKKQPGIVNICGICSPGLSSAPAIAEYVVKLLNFKDKEKDCLSIEPYKFLRDLSQKEQNKLIKSDPDYGKIVCKCEKVTVGDIKAVLNRPLKVKSVDGIKRRTNAGMGLCQGGFCFTRVVELIAESNGIEYKNVLKENRGSNVAISNIREK